MWGRVVLLGLVLVLVIHCLHLNFTQDDAFISFRYVKNLVSGNGLVFNPGERVEGYTNFLWIMLLAIGVRAGLSVVLLSKILGIASGAGIVVLLYLLTSRHVRKEHWYVALLPSAFLVANSSFAYWSISGLETSLFSLAILFSIWLYSHSRRYVAPLLAVSTMIRPEGVLVFFVFLLYQILAEKRDPKEYFLFFGQYCVLLLPYAIFKYSYYGDLLPNTFYAKTGFSFEHLRSGVEYFFRFLKYYGGFGIAYLIPLYLYRNLSSPLRLLVWILFGYTFYIILIGGDVLKVHRFFIPLLSLVYLVSAVAVERFSLKVQRKPVLRWILISLVALALAGTFFLPREWVLRVRESEVRLVQKMEFMGKKLKEEFGTDRTLAVSTIGAISYYGEAVVVDMLGLTDKHIARQPEQIEGIPGSWKEKKYNATYVLSRDPDFIVFSTFHKPSAPAERALFLHSEFRQGYYLFYLPWKRGEFEVVFRRKDQFTGEDRVLDDPEFINLYSDGLHHLMQGMYQRALAKLLEVTRVAPRDFALPYEQLGLSYWYLEDYQKALEHLRRAVSIDPFSVIAHLHLAHIYFRWQRYEEASREFAQIDLYNPGFKTEETEILRQAVERARAGGQ